MLALVISLVLSASPASWPGPEACVAAQSSCQADAADAPAELDCAAPVVRPLQGAECTETPLLFWYRASRTADSERPSGSLAPAPRRAPASHVALSGDVPRDAGSLTPPRVPPLALVALPTIGADRAPSVFPVSARALPARALAPPDRPPRG